jgi:purine-binding chemotaxis protein CheW
MDFLRIRQKARERARDREPPERSRGAPSAEPGAEPGTEPGATTPVAAAADPPPPPRVEPHAAPAHPAPDAEGALPVGLDQELAELEEALRVELSGLGPRTGAARLDEEEPDPLDEFFWREDETAPQLPDLVAASELPVPQPPPARREWVTFRLGTEEYALEIQHVREVLKAPPLTELPRAPEHILGVIMVRGEIVAVIDPRARLGLPRQEPGPRARVLVCDTGETSCGVLVDEVSGVIRLAPSAVEPRPPGVGGESVEYIAGIGRERNRLYVLLDAATLLGNAVTARPGGALP